MILIGVGLFIAVNFMVITMTSRKSLQLSGAERVGISIISPIQSAVSRVMGLGESIWSTYFLSVLAVAENQKLKTQLAQAIATQNRCEELALENARLKKFVKFTDAAPAAYVAAQVIARDPSPWFKTIMIDKGTDSGLKKGAPVVVSEGIVGQIIEVAKGYSRVLLIIDRNSAVDALVQNTRVRGIVKGNNEDTCAFVYARRNDEVKVGEMIVSSGFDQVFPKGLRIGQVIDVKKVHSQLFQNIIIETSVDFDKLEDVLIYKNGN